MNTPNQPLAKVEDGRLDIQLNQQKSQTGKSEKHRPWAEKRINRFDWLGATHTTIASASIGLFCLNLAWLMVPIAPSYHLFIRWSLFAAPMVLAIVAVVGVRMNIGSRVVPDWVKYLFFAALGLTLAWFAHGAF